MMMAGGGAVASAANSSELIWGGALQRVEEIVEAWAPFYRCGHGRGVAVANQRFRGHAGHA